jgi:integrase
MGANNKPPKYRHHKASNQAFVEIHKRRIYLGVFGTEASRLRYRQMIAERWAAPPPPRPVNLPRDVTIPELLEAYKRHAEEWYRRRDPYAKRSPEHDRAEAGDGDGAPLVPTRSFKNIWKPALLCLLQFGDMRAKDFQRQHLKQLRNAWIDEICPTTNRRRSRKTVNEYVGAVKRFFHWAADESHVPGQVWADLQAVQSLKSGRSRARETKRVQPVTDDYIKAALPHLPPVVADMVRLQRITGARPGEIRMLRHCDVQRWTTLPKPPPLAAAEKVQPERDETVWEYRPATHKT